jgi:uncharacterized membrane protein
VHYFPISLPFLLIIFSLVIFLLILIEVGILGYAYQKIGIQKRYAYTLLLLCLLGSYINIPVYQLPPEVIRSGGQVVFFGVPYMVPMLTRFPGNVVAVNVGGALIPTLLSIYLILKNKLFFKSLAGTAAVAVVAHLVAHPVPGVGIAVPFLIPPAAATAAALLLSRERAPALAFICGTLGTLIGADLLNLGKLQGLGAPVASIGGAGTFDGIFSTGILAVLLAALMAGKRRPD